MRRIVGSALAAMLLSVSCVPTISRSAPLVDDLPPDACEMQGIDTRRTASVARCQVAPIRSFHVLSVVRTEAALFIERGNTSANADTEPAFSCGVERTASGLQTHNCDGLATDRVSQVRALAEAILGRPGAPARPRPAKEDGTSSQEIAELEEFVRAVVDLRIREEPTSVVVTVRFQARRRERYGDVRVFDVTLSGSESSAAMCHQWLTRAHAYGELALRASDGAIVGLHLRGPLWDTETGCPEGAKEKGVSDAPRTCNDGEMVFSLDWMCTRPMRR